MAKILIVDENDDIRLFHRILLEELDGYKIFDVGTGAAAIDVLAQEKFDVMVIALKSADVAGAQLLNFLHLQQPDLPVVINTDYRPPKDYFHASALVPKPSGFPGLEEALAYIMAGIAVPAKYQENAFGRP